MTSRGTRTWPWLVLVATGAGLFFLALTGCLPPAPPGDPGSGGSGGAASGAGGSGGNASNGGTSGSGSGGTTGTASAEQHCLDQLNMYRQQAGAPPLQLDATLSMFSVAASQDLANGGAPHNYFIQASNSGSIWNDGFCNGAAENQAPGWPAQDLNSAIDSILQTMMAEGPGGGHHDNIVNPQNGIVGVGLVVVQGQLYFTNDFSPACH